MLYCTSHLYPSSIQLGSNRCLVSSLNKMSSIIQYNYSIWQLFSLIMNPNCCDKVHIKWQHESDFLEQLCLHETRTHLISVSIWTSNFNQWRHSLSLAVLFINQLHRLMIKPYLYFPAFAIDVDLFQEGLAEEAVSKTADLRLIKII